MEQALQVLHQVSTLLGELDAIMVELENPANAAVPIEAELTREQYEELNLQEGESVIVRTKNVRVFPKIDYLSNRVSV